MRLFVSVTFTREELEQFSKDSPAVNPDELPLSRSVELESSESLGDLVDLYDFVSLVMHTAIRHGGKMEAVKISDTESAHRNLLIT